MSVVFGIVIYAEYSNCLMYISPTSVFFDDLCIIVCIIPMLTTAMVECRLFAYFLLMRERLKIINQSIDFYRKNLNSLPIVELHNANDDRMKGIRSKIFFITEFRSKKINERVRTKTDNGWKSNFAEKHKSMMSSFWRSVKNLLNVRKNKIFVDNFDSVYKNDTMKNTLSSHDYVEQVCSMQIIYSKLYEITDLISKAYGIQMIAIISVQFITLTTLLYHFTMKTIRWEFVTKHNAHRWSVNSTYTLQKQHKWSLKLLAQQIFFILSSHISLDSLYLWTKLLTQYWE